jgi:sulfur carrier protein ThiS
MTVQLTYRGKKWEERPGTTARDAVKKAGLNPEEVLVVRNGRLVTDDTVLDEGDDIQFIAVISGG